MTDAANSPDAKPRTRLRDFQVQLLERMRIARSDAAPAVHHLGAMTGERRWLLDLQQAGEIIAPGVIASVPMTQDWFLGLTNVRGNLISVIDFGRFLGLPPTAADKASRIIVLAPSLAACSGLLVSRVLGLRSRAGMREDEAKREAPEPAWCGRSFFDQESQRWTELDLSRVTQDARFIDVAR